MSNGSSLLSLPPAVLGRTKTKRTVATIGAAGVGKSTLTAALANLRRQGSSQAYQRSPRPPRHRGPTTVVEYATKACAWRHYDCPALGGGDDDRLRRRLAQVDAAILVLDVQVDIAEQSGDLLRLAQQQGLPLIVPFLNKCDLAVNTPLSDELEEHVEALLGAHGFTPITPIWGAAWPALGNRASTWHECLEQLLLHLDYSVSLSF